MSGSGNSAQTPGSAAPESTSTSLLRRVKAQDQQAWRQLVDLYGPLVYTWCRQSGLREEDAADIGQEVFSAVSIHLSGFR